MENENLLVFDNSEEILVPTLPSTNGDKVEEDTVSEYLKCAICFNGKSHFRNW